MRKFFLVGFFALMCCDTLAQCGTKLASLHAGPLAMNARWLLDICRERWLWLGLAGYLGAFVTWMTLLKHTPVGPAFAASHIEMVSVLFLSVYWLGEKLNGVQMAGCLLILGGIVLLATESRPGARGRP